MKRFLLSVTLLLLSYTTWSQVGISNTDPKASLDITASNTASPANTDGILIPRIDEFPVSDPGADQDGMMVFVTGTGAPAKGFYFWNNGTTSWTSFGGGIDTRNTLDGAYDEGGAGSGRIITADTGALELQGSGGLRVESDITAGNQIIHDGDSDTFAQFSVDGFQLDAGGRNYMDVQHANQAIVFNENSTASDLRVESDNQQYMLFVDGSNNAIGIGQNNPQSPLHVGIQTTFDLSYSNSGQDGLFLRGSGNNSGVNTVGSSIGFGPPHTARSTQRKAAIAAIQTSGDVDHVGLSFYVHSNGINMSDMVEGMRLTHQGRLGLGFGNTAPDATLDVDGSFQYTDGNESTGYILSSDANGNAAWTDPATLIADTDDQTIDEFSLSGTTLSLSLEDDGVAAQTVDLSSLSNVTSASNGITLNAGAIELGGSLNQNTTITHSTYNTTFNLDSSGEFYIQDAGTTKFEMDNTGDILFGGNLYVRNGSTAGTNSLEFTSTGNVGRIGMNSAGTQFNLLQATGDSYFTGGSFGLGLTNPQEQLDVSDETVSYVADFLNESTNTVADGISVRLTAANPNASAYYVGFFRDSGSTVSGRISGTGTGVNYVTTSDRRLKSNITDVEDALSIVLEMRPRLYNYIEQPEISEYGFIAQELKSVYPQAVTGDPNSDVRTDPMMVDYSRVTPILAAGIQELHQKIKKLEEDNDLLKKRLQQYEELERRLATLEANVLKSNDP